MSDEVVRLWREDDGERRLIELRRSMFIDADAFRRAIEFHEDRGAVLEERPVAVQPEPTPLNAEPVLRVVNK